MSEKGARWLLQAVDPFSDVKRDAVGYPDSNGALTITRVQNKKITITAPPGLSGTQYWDLLICNMPNLCNTSQNVIYDTFDNLGCLQNASAQTLSPSPGPIWVHRALSGQNLVPTSVGSAFTSTLFSAQAVDVGTSLIGMVRCVGGGMELVCTSPTTTTSGAINVAKFNNTLTNSNLLFGYNDGGGFSAATMSEVTNGNMTQSTYSNIGTLPPANAASVSILPNLQTFTATEGCYSVFTQNTTVNPLKLFENVPIVFKGDNIPEEDSSSTVAVSTSATGDSITGSYAVFTQSIPIPFDSTVIFATGLNAQTTFDFTVKFYIEEGLAPASELADMGKPSPPIDTMALDMYTRIISTLPSGVVVSENYKGEWVEGLLSFISKVAVPVSSAVGLGFLGAPIAAGAGALAGLTRSKYGTPQANRP
jgi:hypothetical protein